MQSGQTTTQQIQPAPEHSPNRKRMRESFREPEVSGFFEHEAPYISKRRRVEDITSWPADQWTSW